MYKLSEKWWLKFASRHWNDKPTATLCGYCCASFCGGESTHGRNTNGIEWTHIILEFHDVLPIKSGIFFFIVTFSPPTLHFPCFHAELTVDKDTLYIFNPFTLSCCEILCWRSFESSLIYLPVYLLSICFQGFWPGNLRVLQPSHSKTSISHRRFSSKARQIHSGKLTCVLYRKASLNLRFILRCFVSVICMYL